MKIRLTALILLCSLFITAFGGCASGQNGGSKPEKEEKEEALSVPGGSSTSSKESETVFPAGSEDDPFGYKAPEYGFAFSDSDGSPPVSVSQDSLASFEEYVSSVDPEFMYSELYGLEESLDRIFSYKHVEEHENTDLYGDGNLSAEKLMADVKKNNVKYLEQTRYVKSLFEEPDDDYMLGICELIVATVKEMEQRQPELDKTRVGCNLGDLKIFYKTGLLSNAEVTTEMVLLLGRHTLSIVDLLSGKNGTRDVIIHETMHMIQFGCDCERQELCKRRVGITSMWDDLDIQGVNWAWFFESSAESNMCLLTGDKPVTYHNMINYLQDVNLITFMRSDVPAYYAQKICFFDDPEMLFSVLNADSAEEKTEVAQMMFALHIMHDEPDDFLKACGEKYGIDVTTDEGEDTVIYAVKPSICIELAKRFYLNLASLLAQGDGVTLNDVMFMIGIFESSMDYHMLFSSGAGRERNSMFIEKYTALRDAFFKLLNENGVTADTQTYLSYDLVVKEDKATVNASLSWLDADKKDFLLERITFLESYLDSKVS